MARAKTEYFLKPEVRLAAWAAALGHPARIAILKVLAEQPNCTCGTVVEALPLAQATVSQHLKALQRAGLITATPDGVRVHYALEPETLQAFGQSLKFLLFQLRQAPQ